ncbi:hypothetical protein L596_027020 [Steinernema carpocapsae]|uniref:Uncharacterized protein n=1 Tax=Steinernema carpocapsae TaxID=34508 RepID=A0A4U5M335_STECR|nr:hypothetical protein L596_027020 [Steinernema carpocapsae]
MSFNVKFFLPDLTPGEKTFKLLKLFTVEQMVHDIFDSCHQINGREHWALVLEQCANQTATPIPLPFSLRSCNSGCAYIVLFHSKEVDNGLLLSPSLGLPAIPSLSLDSFESQSQEQDSTASSSHFSKADAWRKSSDPLINTSPVPMSGPSPPAAPPAASVPMPHSSAPPAWENQDDKVHVTALVTIASHEPSFYTKLEVKLNANPRPKIRNLANACKGILKHQLEKTGTLSFRVAIRDSEQKEYRDTDDVVPNLTYIVEFAKSASQDLNYDYAFLVQLHTSQLQNGHPGPFSIALPREDICYVKTRIVIMTKNSNLMTAGKDCTVRLHPPLTARNLADQCTKIANLWKRGNAFDANVVGQRGPAVPEGERVNETEAYVVTFKELGQTRLEGPNVFSYRF